MSRACRILVVDTMTTKEINEFPAADQKAAERDFLIVTKKMSDHPGRYKWSLQVEIEGRWYDQKNRYTEQL